MARSSARSIFESISTRLGAPLDPGMSRQNGSNESFNGNLRDECLETQWFLNRIDSKVAIEDWRWPYDEVRSHSSLENLGPVEYARKPSSRNY